MNLKERSIKQLALVTIVLVIISAIALASSTKVTLVVDGNNNIAYSGAINQVWNNGLSEVSEETARLANSYISACGPKQIVLLDPTPQNIKDFSELANYHNAKLIIGSTPNETELKSNLFELGLDNKKVKFKTNQDWDPDNYKNIGNGYTY